MEFIKQKLPIHEFPSGVYKITFNDKWFYIGSTQNIKIRLVRWKNVINKPQHFACERIKEILTLVTKVEFKVLKICNDYTNQESLLIDENKGNEFLLNNRTPFGGNRRVAKFDKSNKLLCIYNSIELAAKDIGCGKASITDDLKGRRVNVKGFTFKLVANDGSFINHPIKKDFHKLNSSIIVDIKNLRHNGVLMKEIAKQFNVSVTAISNVINNKTYVASKYVR